MSQTANSEDPKPAPKTGFPIRGALAVVPVFVFFLGVALMMAIGGSCSSSFRRSGFVRVVRAWGRLPLWLLGVRLETTGWEYAAAKGPKLVLFNHVSLLDLLVLAALCPDKPVVLYKKEIGRVFGLGWALRTLRMIAVDRDDHEAALASMREANDRLHNEGVSLLIAPEGTRSRSGGLQRFKLGAFHLAATTHVPIVSMVMRGVEDVLPMGTLLVRKGTVRVDFLPPVDTTDWKIEDIRKHADEVRAQFLEFVPAAPKKKRKPRKKSGTAVEKTTAESAPQDLDIESK